MLNTIHPTMARAMQIGLPGLVQIPSHAHEAPELCAMTQNVVIADVLGIVAKHREAAALAGDHTSSRRLEALAAAIAATVQS